MCPPKILAMIPARLESGKIYNQNIRYLSGKPLIAHTIEIAKSAECFSGIWVNTSDSLIKDVAQDYGVHIHHRPSALLNDSATAKDFIAEFFQKHSCEFVVMVNTAFPALRPETVREFCNFVSKDQYDTVFGAVQNQTEIFYNYKPLNFNLNAKVNSRLLSPTQGVCWALSAWRRETFLRLFEEGVDPTFGGAYTVYHLPPNEVMVLDDEKDWSMFEGILRLRDAKHEPQYYGSSPKANARDLGPTPNSFSGYIDYLNNGLEKMEVLAENGDLLDGNEAMRRWAEMTLEVQQAGGTIFFAGNGASASMAEHMSADLYKNGEINTTSCSETAYLTAIGNDISFDEIFSFKIRKSFTPADMLVTISSSGNSPNVINAIEAAKLKGGKVVTLSGFMKTNQSCRLGVLNFFVPAMTYGAVEVAHTGILHCWVDQFLMLLGKKKAPSV